MRRSLYRSKLVTLAVALSSIVLGCKSSADEEGEDKAEFKECNAPTLRGEVLCDPTAAGVKFTLESKNRHYPLHVGSVVILEGNDEGQKVRVERRVLDETMVVMGVTTHVLEAKEFKNDKLYEVARNFYVESERGDVCYFGEDVTFYDDNGKPANNHGSWRAGVGNAKPGLIMPANPTVNQSYYQENAPGVAQDQGRISATNGTVTFGNVTYSDVVTIEDGNPLEACDSLEPKIYVPGVGEAGDTTKKLISFTEAPFKVCTPPTITSASVCDPLTAKFTLASTNRYFPLRTGQTTILEGTEEGVTVRVERKVLPDTETVLGITTHVLESRELRNGKLFEIARDFYAETETGDVCYFGEDVTFYEDGGVTPANHHGTWRAGFGNAKPGLIMPAKPAAGHAYFQEDAPGLAHDMGRVATIDTSLTLAGTTYQSIVTIKETNPLEACATEEEKLYAPEVGEVGDGVKKLVSFTPGTAP